MHSFTNCSVSRSIEYIENPFHFFIVFFCQNNLDKNVFLCQNTVILAIWNDWPKLTEGFDFVSFLLQRTKRLENRYWRFFLASTLHEFTKRPALMPALHELCLQFAYTQYFLRVDSALSGAIRQFARKLFCRMANYENDYGYRIDQINQSVSHFWSFFSRLICDI